ncbi:CofH family radical SAM protein [Bacteroidota bacterium]
MNTELLIKTVKEQELKQIVQKIIHNKRISVKEGKVLYEKADIGLLAILANYCKENKTGKKVYFNKNIHIEPTNICIYNCKFCSYRRKKGEEGTWELNRNEIIDTVERYKNTGITEIHIVGGTHPHWDTLYWSEVLKEIKEIFPSVYIKAFTAVELENMFNKSGISIIEGIKMLKESGLDAIPGGGAEIFSSEIREKICQDKTSSEDWLRIHEIAHKERITSNATMLYGHIETYEHRLDHMDRLRNLQDKTKGFSAFIPLKYKSKHNAMEQIGEVSVTEDFKNFAISRIFLDNFLHIKSYWPMLGKDNARISLSFGINDIDGTIEDTTKIYSMAGAEVQSPSMTEEEIITLIKNEGLIPVERDTIYNEINVYDS